MKREEVYNLIDELHKIVSVLNNIESILRKELKGCR